MFRLEAVLIQDTEDVSRVPDVTAFFVGEQGPLAVSVGYVDLAIMDEVDAGTDFI